MARLEFPIKVKRAITKRANGKCECCNAALKQGEGEVDHILPCALGGEPTIANGRLICRVCHKGKTAVDLKRFRKADRQNDYFIGLRKTNRPIKSAPFAKSEKVSKRQPKAALPPRPLFRESRS